MYKRHVLKMIRNSEYSKCKIWNEKNIIKILWKYDVNFKFQNFKIYKNSNSKSNDNSNVKCKNEKCSHELNSLGFFYFVLCTFYYSKWS